MPLGQNVQGRRGGAHWPAAGRYARNGHRPEPCAPAGASTDAEASIAIEGTTGRKNLLLLIQLRWIAVVSQAVTIAVVHLWLEIALPIGEMAAVVLFLAALNAASMLRWRVRPEISRTELFIELLLDVAALTALLYLSGGAFNPFISLYLLQVILGAVLLDAWAVWAIVAATSLCFVSLTVFHRPMELPHQHGSNFLNLHIQGMFICFMLAAVLLVFFVTRINRNLALRDAGLAELRQQAAEQDHVIRMGLLASGAAHELGTPLATISVILSDWRRMPAFAGDEAMRQELAEAQDQLDRCKAIVSGILMSSGEARGEGTVRTTIRRFLDDVAAEWSGRRPGAALDYDNRFEPDVAVVWDTALKQMLFNVLDNAFEASPSRVVMEATRRGDRLAIVVSDRGPGFAPEILARFGQPYASTKARPGAGLGLFLVVNVVRKLGGEVSARNGPAGGATVAVELPVAAFAEKTA